MNSGSQADACLLQGASSQISLAPCWMLGFDDEYIVGVGVGIGIETRLQHLQRMFSGRGLGSLEVAPADKLWGCWTHRWSSASAGEGGQTARPRIQNPAMFSLDAHPLLGSHLCWGVGFAVSLFFANTPCHCNSICFPCVRQPVCLLLRTPTHCAPFTTARTRDADTRPTSQPKHAPRQLAQT